MAKSGKLVVLLGVLMTFSLSSHVTGQIRPKSGLFPIGDSYYDVGNKKYLTKEFLPSTTWPYGKSTDRPNGRYSDGRVVPDFIATFLNQPIPIPPALQNDADFTSGAGFAVGGATVLDGPSETMTLAQQVEKFGDMKSTWDEKFLSEAIFVFQIGTEDYLNFSKLNPNPDASTQQAFVTLVTNKIKTEIIRLYSLGARKFAYQTLAPLGCLPIVRQEHQLEGEDCYEKLNEIAKQHNDKIRPMLAELAKTYTGFQYTVFDFYGAIERRLAVADSDTIFNNYRFSNTVNSCCGIGSHNAFGCGRINVHSKLCEYPREYLFFDGQHNSEKANEEMAHLFFGADKDIVGPMTIRELSVYPIGMNMLEY
ncbi:PREDICTED: GDSL esterase/lipase ESM1-like isoform X2 [Tarenaya hassleriana]|uniref:GDSL esterase/lipase ESM1-like isoform X1 n=1 Tax=Tarenaya hassleriana TaxID=28532 RepID=UPI00053C3A53|nr:PREDICTED: GDSL esterase/lipase ESM1-like isoform X1 [Tarenaya hassleriana]XP_010534972.1 PREDICTED: GDSL esterase/lipase ESM1-like isoform X2 [Tarenaya hassleriana]